MKPNGTGSYKVLVRTPSLLSMILPHLLETSLILCYRHNRNIHILLPSVKHWSTSYSKTATQRANKTQTELQTYSTLICE